MNKFHLAEGVYFVAGAKCGALYNTNSGNVFSINETAKRILEGKEENNDFWRQLVTMELADYGSPGNNEHTRFPEEEIKLEFIWFEIISDDCNERCAHCYADSMPPTYRQEMRILPAKPQETHSLSNKLTYQQWIALIKESYELGCRMGQFIGGEPFLYRGEGGETVLDLAEYARTVGYERIEIFTNATLLTPQKVFRIKDLGLSVAVSLYSDNPAVHDRITRTPGSYRKTIAALNHLREAGVPTRVETVLMRPNQHTVESTIKLIDDMGFDHSRPDVLRPKGRGDSPALLPSPEILVQYGLLTEPNFYADKAFLTRSYNGHNCLAGKVTITDTGDVLPCIFSRNQVLGNILTDGSLGSAITTNKTLQKTWHTTKDDVLVCQDCEYRYVCFDCRPISEAVSGKNNSYFTAPYPRCTYNPYTGEWGGGVWRLNEEDQPFYDETFSPLITEMKAKAVAK